MLAHERQKEILKMLRENHSIKMSEISEKFSVSTETVRRDLEYLQNQKLLKRVYGGAIPADNLSAADETKLQEAPSASPDQLSLLAGAAYDYISDNDSIFIGPGDTMHQLSKWIRRSPRTRLTVLTNSLSVLTELANLDLTLYCLGGLLSPDEHHMYGTVTDMVAQKFYISKTFISCGGISLDGSVTCYSPGSTLQEIMIRQAEKRYLIADSSKFDRNAFFKIGNIRDFDAVISDRQLKPEYRELIAQSGIELKLYDEPAF